ncbi:MAG TPA: tetratricopeptide repeat protein [Thermoanaerobaculia bacterium]|nr:tetratricopeptide repeat protein [Thermoanaerobaculia bacterium]
MLTTILLFVQLLAQTQIQTGEALIAQSKWSEARPVFEEATRANPNDAAAWAALGLVHFNLGAIDSASAAYEKAIALDATSARAIVGVARVAIARADTKTAIAGLTRARDAGIPVLQFVRTSTGFDALVKKDAEFARFTESLRPCGGPEYRQFDFWLGTWDVFNPAGQKIGTNRITSTNDGCVVYEDWRDARGGTGNSFNFYEAKTKRWHQFWVNSNGNAMPIAASPDGTPMPMSGGLVDGAMVLQSPAGVKPLNRWTWSRVEGGKLRQHAEQSDDDGKTWKTVFDGTYVKAK